MRALRSGTPTRTHENVRLSHLDFRRPSSICGRIGQCGPDVQFVGHVGIVQPVANLRRHALRHASKARTRNVSVPRRAAENTRATTNLRPYAGAARCSIPISYGLRSALSRTIADDVARQPSDRARRVLWLPPEQRRDLTVLGKPLASWCATRPIDAASPDGVLDLVNLVKDRSVEWASPIVGGSRAGRRSGRVLP
jgi:hypothetical protein